MYNVVHNNVEMDVLRYDCLQQSFLLLNYNCDCSAESLGCRAVTLNITEIYGLKRLNFGECFFCPLLNN